MNRSKVIPVSILLLLQAGDLISTRLAFSVGAVELNPLVRLLGLWPAKLLVVGLVLVLAVKTRKAARVWFCAGYYALIFFSNTLIFALHAH